MPFHVIRRAFVERHAFFILEHLRDVVLATRPHDAISRHTTCICLNDVIASQSMS